MSLLQIIIYYLNMLEVQNNMRIAEMKADVSYINGSIYAIKAILEQQKKQHDKQFGKLSPVI